MRFSIPAHSTLLSSSAGLSGKDLKQTIRRIPAVSGIRSSTASRVTALGVMPFGCMLFGTPLH
jgi:hypothetical protein